MKYAVIKIGTKQYMVHEGDMFELERQEQPLKFSVLAYNDGVETQFGKPELAGITVKLEATEKRGKKIRVARFKSKSRYDKVNGHRQPMSVVKVVQIGEGGATVEPAKAPIKKEKPTKTATVAKKAPTTEKKSSPRKKTVTKVKESK